MEEKQVLLKMGSKAERCMVFGIVSIMLSFLFAPASIVFSIIGLRMYKKAIAEGASGGILMAGYVLSLIGLTMSTVMLVVSIISIIFVIIFGYSAAMGGLLGSAIWGGVM